MFTGTLKRGGAAWTSALLATALLVPQLAWAAPITPREAAAKALSWMKTQQQSDGSFAGFGAGSTVDAVLAIEAEGQNPASFANGGKSAVDFLESKVADFAKTPGSAGKALLAVGALGSSFGGTRTLLDAIGQNYPASGHYGQDSIGHAFAMLGLAAAGMPVPPKADEYLRSVQGSDGGWSFSGDTKPGSSDTNTTSVAIQALIAAGVPSTDSSLQKALLYLTSQANEDGGFPYQKGSANGSESDVNSTSYVVQALVAMGSDASKPTAFLLSMQKANGAFQWMKSVPDDNAGATYQAVPALLGVTLLPLAAQQPAPQPGVTPAPVPGMPTTGAPIGAPAAIAVLGALLFSLGGLALRRFSVLR